MYAHLLVAIDNSRGSAQAAAAALALAQKFGARLEAVHATDPALHRRAFRLLEHTLPERYQQEPALARQRAIHEQLIGRGLALISESYLEPLRIRAQAAGIACTTRVIEGRHHDALAEEIARCGCPLAVFGHLGLGASERAALGGVVARVARRVAADLLVVRGEPFASERGRRAILVAVDGSEYSASALRKALVLAHKFCAEVHAIHVFDPDFHRTVFRELAAVLSAEAAAVFDCAAQQALHEEIIDQGLARVAGKLLHECRLAAERAGVPLRTALARGKVYERIVEAAARLDPMLLVVGRLGRHRVASSDLGTTAENVARFAHCSVLLAGCENGAAPG